MRAGTGCPPCVEASCPRSDLGPGRHGTSRLRADADMVRGRQGPGTGPCRRRVEWGNQAASRGERARVGTSSGPLRPGLASPPGTSTPASLEWCARASVCSRRDACSAAC